MARRNHIKYKFSKDKALTVQKALLFIENKRYLDKNGIVKKVKKIIVTPYDETLLASFLREPNLLSEYARILDNYPTTEYAILFFLETSNLYIHNYTIEEFELEFGLRSSIMEMVVGLSDA